MNKVVAIEGFRDRLEQAIFDSGLSLNEICTRAQIGRNNLWSYRWAGVTPSCDKLRKLAITLNVSTDWLLGLRG